MSKYGRLWENALTIRAKLGAKLPDLPQNFTPADARRELKKFTSKIEGMITRWESVEEAMKREDD